MTKEYNEPEMFARAIKMWLWNASNPTKWKADYVTQFPEEKIEDECNRCPLCTMYRIKSRTIKSKCGQCPLKNAGHQCNVQIPKSHLPSETYDYFTQWAYADIWHQPDTDAYKELRTEAAMNIVKIMKDHVKENFK